MYGKPPSPPVNSVELVSPLKLVELSNCRVPLS